MSSQMSRKLAFKDINSTNITKITKKSSSQVKTEAFGDKENLTERSHVQESLKTKLLINNAETKEKQDRNAEVLDQKRNFVESSALEEKSQVNTSNRSVTKEKSKKIIETVHDEKKKGVNDPLKINKITVEDLTSDNHSEYYWKLVAEKRQEALRETLDENAALRQKISVLEEKAEMLEKALAESTDVIDLLNEVVAEKDTLKETAVTSSNNSESENIEVKRKVDRVENKSIVDTAFGDDTYNESDDSEND